MRLDADGPATRTSTPRV